MKCERIDLYLNHDQPLVADELSRFKTLIKRRINREPVAYIIGVKEFWSMDLAVTRDVLIPRPETECLVEAALDFLSENSGSQSKRILDVGTGSGAIILALASQKPGHLYFASDLFPKAVELARKNAERHNLLGYIHFFVGDWFSGLNPVKSGFDMIVSNPPYIPGSLIPKLQPEIYRFEPVSALDGNEDGLFCLRKIIGAAYHYLKPYGVLLLEVGYDQRDYVHAIVSQCGRYEDVYFKKDYSEYDRVVHMRKKR